MKRTVVIGASTNPTRYSHKAVIAVSKLGHEVFPIGIKEGKIAELDIITDRPEISYVDTVTIYLSNKYLETEREYIFSLKPKRIIMNPGAEHKEFQEQARKHGILVEEACTLVMVATDAY